MRVLLACANQETTELVLGALARDHHGVSVIDTAKDTWAKLAYQAFDVLIIDNRLPDASAIDMCRIARANGVASPILLLAQARSVDRHIQGLDAGADDSLAKPFAVAELRARVRALGRRSVGSRAVVQVRGDVVLDLPRRLATVRGEEVTLTMKEWAIITALAGANGRVIPRGRLIEDVWGEENASSAASLEVLLTRIRKKLGHEAIRTLRTQGYALAVP